MNTDYRTEEDKKRYYRQRDRQRGCWLLLLIVLILGYTATESVLARVTDGRYGPVTTVNVTNITSETINVENITNVTEIILQDGGEIGGGSGKGKIKYTDTAIDVISVKTALLRLQLQDDDTAIVNTTLLGRVDVFGDDDTPSADEIAAQIDVTATSTWTDGDEDSRMELSVINNGVLNDDQLVLNTDGTVDVGTPQVGGLEQTYRFNMADPATLQGIDAQWSLDPRTSAAMTITRIDITLDADPTTEINANLKFADAFIGLASATLIVALDTTNGTSEITSFTDATVPANKCVYLEFDATPDVATTQMCVTVYWDYD